MERKEEQLICGDGFKLRAVEINDAEFIVSLRTDKRLGQNLSWTSSSVAEQVNWIEKYKQRESQQTEYYFIIEDLDRTPWGTIRIYNVTADSFTIGSWICLPNSKNNIAIKAWLSCVDYAFDRLNFDICLFDVRKKNTAVLYFAYLFQPTSLYETELDYFFSLDKKTFYKNQVKVAKLLKINQPRD